MRNLVPITLIIGLATAGSAQADALWQRYEAKDFFDLRERLPPRRESESERLTLLRAATDAAFARHADAIARLHGLLRHRPSIEIQDIARRLLMREERAGGDYRAALSAIDPLLSRATEPDEGAELRNSARLLEAIADVPPQRVERVVGPNNVRRDKDGRFDLTIGGTEQRLGFDTGANFSFLARSVAVKAGLKVRSSGISLGTSNGADAQTDIAVGDVVLGPYRVRNVVFLILPDASLTMPDGFFMPGLLGFPVLSALGNIRYVQDGSLRFEPGARKAGPNLALDGNDVLVRVGYGDTKLLCRLDTGADNTVFYEPFYRRFPALFGDPSRKIGLKLGSVSGAREIPAYKLTGLDVVLAGKPVHLDTPSVMMEPIAKPQDNHLDCNVGIDALRPFGSYAIDLQRLRLEIGSDGH
jgi:predicted aspartyl protease